MSYISRLLIEKKNVNATSWLVGVQVELQKSGFAQDRFALDPNRETSTITSAIMPPLLVHKFKGLENMLSTSPLPLPTKRYSSSSGSTYSIRSETFGTWLVATEKYGTSDEESGVLALSPLDVSEPQFPPGLECAEPSIPPSNPCVTMVDV